MLWDPFLIKKLLKSVICGTVNSTHMHCSQLTKSTIAGWKKKKKKRKTWRRKRRRANQIVTLINLGDCCFFFFGYLPFFLIGHQF